MFLSLLRTERQTRHAAENYVVFSDNINVLTDFSKKGEVQRSRGGKITYSAGVK